jgi:hypothetical protein
MCLFLQSNMSLCQDVGERALSLSRLDGPPMKVLVIICGRAPQHRPAFLELLYLQYSL